ncbi:NAD(P)H-dependent flavin oxidoreductase [Mycolicibacterium sediminis]|uniref:Propionate 3-nitronate monooxygenase n=1 Tax=Mycolicibacterium sediminis TaxID=1286180 RepID=A0A7I7QKH9_9MYCO|nr:nitronate monooxygenase [Mycolicibacterium sediminis]BBY26784.1 oxidoreductase [Mycolicibacterium sediminis]
MTSPLADLGLTIPVVAAPMAGGGTTPAMVIAAHGAGGLGFLAAGYKTAEALAGAIDTVRAAGVPFGVNVFAPNPVPITPQDYRAYRSAVQGDADRYGLTLPDDVVDDDDHFAAKIELLLAQPVPLVSFTFGIPDPDVVARLRRAGTIVGQTVTSLREAATAEAAGVDLLVLQGIGAGGHSGTLTPDRPPADVVLADLVAEVVHGTSLPVVAAGGLATAGAVAAVLDAGAEAVAVGTVLLLSDESGASATHRAALTDPHRTETVLTRAFTGRPARGLRNDFIERHDASAPLGYPAIHHLTSPLRKAAAAAGDADLVHLWAGTGYREARQEPTAAVMRRLAGEA